MITDYNLPTSTFISNGMANLIIDCPVLLLILFIWNLLIIIGCVLSRRQTALLSNLATGFSCRHNGTLPPGQSVRCRTQDALYRDNTTHNSVLHGSIPLRSVHPSHRASMSGHGVLCL